jgi:hypothetical protein
MSVQVLVLAQQVLWVVRPTYVTQMLAQQVLWVVRPT